MKPIGISGRGKRCTPGKSHICETWPRDDSFLGRLEACPTRQLVPPVAFAGQSCIDRLLESSSGMAAEQVSFPFAGWLAGDWLEVEQERAADQPVKMLAALLPQIKDVAPVAE